MELSDDVSAVATGTANGPSGLLKGEPFGVDVVEHLAGGRAEAYSTETTHSVKAIGARALGMDPPALAN